MMKYFVKKENPDEEVTLSNFVFDDKLELLAQSIMLSSDGHLTNFIIADSLTIQLGTRNPFEVHETWEKTITLLHVLIAFCIVKYDIVINLTASKFNG